MTPDEQVIVLGGDDAGSPEVERRPGRRGSPLWLLAAVLGLFAVLIAFVLVPQEEPPTTAEPGGLDAPDEPPSAFVQTPSTLSVDVPPLALGWQEATLVRPGWTVSSVDHGPDGWLAVSGLEPTVAHVSENAVLWHAHTIRGLAVEEAVAAVGDGVMAVFGSSQYEPQSGARPIGAISTDRGATWTTVDHPGLVVVTDVEVVGGRVLVAGAVGDNPGFRWNNDGRAALWEVIDGELVDLGIAATDHSQVNAIVADEGGDVLVLGHTDAGATVWRPSEPDYTVVVELDEFGSRSFLDVEIIESGLVALVGVPGSTDGRWLWTSPDGAAWADVRTTDDSLVDPPAESSVWEEAGTTDETLVGSIAVGPRGLLGLPLSEGRLWSAIYGSVRSSYPGHETGWEQAGLLTDIETDGEVTVMTASGATSGQLFVRGTTVPPVEVVAPLAAGEPRWRIVASVDLAVEELGPYSYPFGVATDGRSTFIPVPGQVFELVDGEGGLELRPSISGVTSFGAGSAGIWASIEGAETQLYLYGSDGVWSTQIVPTQGISSVGVIDGALTVAGWGDQGFKGLRRADDGSWQELRLGEDMWWLYITPGGFVAEQGPPTGLEGQVQTVRSSDGRDWEVLEGWRTRGPGPGGSPFLTNADAPNVIGLGDTVAGFTEVEVPTEATSVVFVERWNDTYFVATVDAVFVGSPVGGWEQYPIDIEHGVIGQAVVIPGALPRIAMLTDGDLVIAEWG